MYRHERKYKFDGPFSDVCEDYIRKNRALGYKYSLNETYLRQFDHFCIGKVKPGSLITQELFEAWVEKRPYESDRSHKIRYRVLRRFCLDLSETVPETYTGYALKHSANEAYESGFAPYIFTVDEVNRVFSAADGRQYSATSPCLHIVLPVLLRLLYSCGLRLSEALTLKWRDVDLCNGTILIRDTKFDKSRKLPLSPSMLAICREYATNMESAFSETEFFFPSNDGGEYAECTVYMRYRECLFKAGIPHGGRGKGPRLHDIRHTFAVHSMRQLAQAGQDLYVTLPILSIYLGHASLAATQKYLRLTPALFQDVTDAFERDFGEVFPKLEVTK